MSDALIFTEESPWDVAEVGGKAAVLLALRSFGFRVPKFLVIGANAFFETGLKPEAKRLLEPALKTLGTGTLAVRSSGREEDGASSSHAGQFLTTLNVDPEDVEPKALEVWRSGLADSVRDYRASRKLNVDCGAPAVIVQRMIEAKCAGVGFCAHPVSGRRDRILIAATSGLADRLVGGEIDGEVYVIDRNTGCVLEQPSSGVLSAENIAELRDLAENVERAQGSPQDFEWAIEETPKGDLLYLLQSRPITTALRPLPHKDGSITIFDNSNIVESYPGLVSPLTYSFAQLVYARVYRAFVGLLGVDQATIRSHGAVFENMLGRVDGRVYYNLINWYRALALLPGFSINRGNMETMMGVGEPLPTEITDSIAPERAAGLRLVREYAKLTKVAGGLIRESFRLRSTIAAFYERLNRALARSPDDVAAMSLTELAGEYRRIESELLDRWDAPLINDFLCMIAFGLSHRLMVRWGGPEGVELHNDVMIGQGDIVSAQPAQMIVKMGALASSSPKILEALSRGDVSALSADPELEQAFRAYLAKFSDRCTEELKLESITLDQDPKPLLAAIVATARSTGKSSHASAETTLNELFLKRPIRRVIMRILMAQAKARVRDRENLRFERTRVFGHARRVFVAMGVQLHALGILEEPRDIFYLTVDEVLGAIEGYGSTANLSGLAALRKTEMKAAASRPDPSARLTFSGSLCAQNVSQVAAPSRSDSEEITRTATGCCAGIVKARAHVIRDPRFEALEPGAILVARHTDPGWIAVFTNASAIVVERGSLLSHSAIVARELGIPCVVGLSHATEWIKTGDLLEVDGSSGLVSKVNG